MAIHSAAKVNIIDIRHDQHQESLLQLMLNGLNSTEAEARHLPTLLLYDGIFICQEPCTRANTEPERGLKLFEQITYLKEYYLTNAEIEVLNTQADRIVERIPRGCRLIELGSGYVHHIAIMRPLVHTVFEGWCRILSMP